MGNQVSDKDIAAKARLEFEKQDKNSYPHEIVTLVSRGHFYPPEHPFSTGEVELKYPTARDEDILTSKNLITKGLAIDTFMKSIIITPVDYNTILLGDKNGIMFASRIMAYGEQYPVKIKCPVCGDSLSMNIDLSNTLPKNIDFDKYPKGVNEFEVVLPTSQKKVCFKLLTHVDEQQIIDEMKQLKKKVIGIGDSEVTTRLKHAIISVDGNTNRGEIWKFVESMLSKDSLFLRGKMMEISPDIESVFDFVCSECGHSDELNIPMEVSFFWPSGKL